MSIHLGNKELKIQKKEIIIVTLVLLIVFVGILFNNKGNKLVCIRTNSTVTLDAKEQYTATFKKGNLSKLKIYYKQTLKPDYLHMLDRVYDNFLRYVTDLKNAGGYDYKIKKGSNYVYYDSIIDINKIPNSSIDTIGYSKIWTYKDIKADLENNNFKCK